MKKVLVTVKGVSETMTASDVKRYCHSFFEGELAPVLDKAGYKLEHKKREEKSFHIFWYRKGDISLQLIRDDALGFVWRITIEKIKDNKVQAAKAVYCFFAKGTNPWSLASGEAINSPGAKKLSSGFEKAVYQWAPDWSSWEIPISRAQLRKEFDAQLKQINKAVAKPNIKVKVYESKPTTFEELFKRQRGG